ncbi:uncharacterized protein LOC111089813 isoform X2 [Limulus polyphemus]|uniref:Uncharacterized protein LOC111089813 isoform X2 n=1 Tax=Limulus polyphemus TaxID=6850 RepID=A0ABM1TRY0_LIMPO|nr:uncharacterized protein LOC111089813 isoform X2 [Limulus polyphemus]
MILVECLEGFNGGLDQTFIMEVYTEETKTLYAKVSSQVPIFLVNGLTQGTVFLLLIYAVNRKGRSSVVQLSTSTVRQAEKLTRERAGTFVFNPVLTVFITMTIALITVIFILVVVVKIRKRAMLKASQQKEDRKVKSETPLQKPVEDVDDGPDIIPAKILNRKLLLCYDHDPDEKPPSHGVLVFSDTTYESPAHKFDVRAETLALQKIPSFCPEEKEQKHAILSETNQNSRSQEKSLDFITQDYRTEESETTEHVLNKKQESVV